MDTLREKVIQNLHDRKARLLEGKLNCIPSPFKRFSNDFIGIEPSCYYAITSGTKGGKSQFTSYTFIFKPLLYCYFTKADINLKILYFPLEETPERIMDRFISWALNEITKGEIRISPRDLRSTTTPVPDKILDIINSDYMQDLLAYFEEHIAFITDITNPTGIYKYCKKYAEDNGVVHYNTITIKDEFGNNKEIKTFSSYESNNPNEYRLILIDTLNLIDTEKGMTLKQSMDKMSEYLAKYLRNRYGFSPVVIVQQAFDTEGKEAIKMNKVRPSVAGIGDSKYCARDSNVVLGLFSPFRFELPEYLGYDIHKFRDNIRFMEVCINRDGEMGGICPLFFDGAISDFKELPLPTDVEGLAKVYKHLNKIRGNNTSISMFAFSIKSTIKNLIKYVQTPKLQH